MTPELRSMLEACIQQASTDNVAFVGVTLQENPAQITFWRNTSDNKEQMAQMFETLAKDIRKQPMVEYRVGKEN